MSLGASARRALARVKDLLHEGVEKRGIAFRYALRAAAVGSLAFIVLLVHRSAYVLVLKSSSYKLPSESARAKVAPPWADPTAGESVVMLEAGRDTLLDPDLVPSVAASFSSNPWVRRADGFVLVDAERIRLPGVYERVPQRAFEVTGAASVPPAAGRAWEGPEIASALEMAALAEGEPVLRDLAVRGVDVANLNGRRDPKSPDLLLATGAGAVIGWGRAPAEARFGEPGLSEKLDNLKRAAENYPRLEGLAFVKVHQKGPARLRPVDSGFVRRTR
jgi:hypothetical protein